MKSKKLNLPKNFFFGSATSSHQIEGGQTNDWSRWEEIPGNICNQDSSRIAAQSFQKWEEDIELLKLTNQNAYRFSVEWSRIEPSEGLFDRDAISHYLNILKKLKKEDIASMLTIFHFTLPQWLDDKGGFRNNKFPFYFERLVERIAKDFGDYVNFYITFNEPNVYISAGFLIGNWYPGRKRDLFGAYKVFNNYIKAHKLAYRAIRKYSSVPIGPAINITALYPKNNNLIDSLLTKIAEYFNYKIFIKPILKECDFIGINYYQKRLIHFGLNMIIPCYDNNASQKALADVLTKLGSYLKPIYVTENGLPDEDDRWRSEFIEGGMEAISAAVERGVDVRGYFHWSLLDNFEWASGYEMKFGLATIDRKLRKSAEVYKRIISENSK